jgi:nicotinamide mononucleotide transporter
MQTALQQISDSLAQMPLLELTAMLLALAYLILIMRENIWGWVCALVSTAIYTVIFWNVNLLMDSALNVYYMAMAVYGWWQWQKGGETHSSSSQLAIQRWKIQTHLIWIALILVATLISGTLLNKHTEAAWPFLDSFTTWGSVFTTYLVARKVLENWWYWMVLNSVSLYLYIDRALYLTAALFIIYLILSVFGYLAWRKSYLNQQNSNASQAS